MNQNQTIVFDMNLDFINIENTRNTGKTNHNWRVIINSTSDPEKLSIEQMKKYGISGYEATHHISFDGNTYSEMSCSYTRNSGVILVKQEFISAIADGIIIEKHPTRVFKTDMASYKSEFERRANNE